MVDDLGSSDVDGKSYTLKKLASLKLFCGVGKNVTVSTVISTLKVCNDGRHLFCLGVETTQVKKSPKDPVYNNVISSVNSI